MVTAHNGITQNIAMRQTDNNMSLDCRAAFSLNRFCADINDFRTECYVCTFTVNACHLLECINRHHVVMADECCCKLGNRFCIHLCRCSGLFNLAVVHQMDHIGHNHGFILVMGNKDSCHIQFLLNTSDLNLQGMSQKGING